MAVDGRSVGGWLMLVAPCTFAVHLGEGLVVGWWFRLTFVAPCTLPCDQGGGRGGQHVFSLAAQEIQERRGQAVACLLMRLANKRHELVTPPKSIKEPSSRLPASRPANQPTDRPTNQPLTHPPEVARRQLNRRRQRHVWCTVRGGRCCSSSLAAAWWVDDLHLACEQQGGARHTEGLLRTHLLNVTDPMGVRVGG